MKNEQLVSRYPPGVGDTYISKFWLLQKKKNNRKTVKKTPGNQTWQNIFKIHHLPNKPVTATYPLQQNEKAALLKALIFNIGVTYHQQNSHQLTILHKHRCRPSNPPAYLNDNGFSSRKMCAATPETHSGTVKGK